MQLTLSINGSATELSAALAALTTAGLGQGTPPSAYIVEADSNLAQIEPEIPTAPASNGKAKVAEKPKGAKVTVKEPVVADIPDEETPATLDMIRLAAKARLAKGPQITEILSAYGASNMSTLEAEYYDAVYEQICAL